MLLCFIVDNGWVYELDDIMSNRLNQEREARLQSARMETAIKAIAAKGYQVEQMGKTQLVFVKDGNVIQYFPYSGWAAGKGIKDGRGLENLLKQI